MKTLRVALEVLYATGIRIGELCSIDLKDIDLEEGAILIQGKGDRERRVFLVDEKVKETIDSYLSERAQRNPVSHRLFVTARGTAATPDHLRKSLNKYTDGLAMNRRITPHMIRHTTATDLLNRGVDIRYVQRLLGHASISTTERYTHISDQQLQREIRSANIRKDIL